MAADDILLDTEDRMDKAIQHLKQQLAGIRTGRANPGLVDSLKVEVYGSQSPMKQLASVGARLVHGRACGAGGHVHPALFGEQRVAGDVAERMDLQ